MITLLSDAGYVFCLPLLVVHDRRVNFFGLKCIWDGTYDIQIKEADIQTIHSYAQYPAAQYTKIFAS